MGRKPRSFGQRLQQLREAAGLTRDELAERAGTSRQYLWRIETDKQVPSWVLVCQLADALKLTPNDFR
jgi:transcriptional regulator with XRE-family HTH domain